MVLFYSHVLADLSFMQVCLSICGDWQVLARFTEMTSRYAQEMQTVSFTIWTHQHCKFPFLTCWCFDLCCYLLLQIDELLKERNAIHASYTSIPPLKRNSSSSKMSSAFNGSNGEEECPTKEKKSKDEKKCRDPKRKKWFKIHLKMDKRKPCWSWCIVYVRPQDEIPPRTYLF